MVGRKLLNRHSTYLFFQEMPFSNLNFPASSRNFHFSKNLLTFVKYLFLWNKESYSLHFFFFLIKIQKNTFLVLETILTPF